MCGRFTRTTPPAALAESFAAAPPTEATPDGILTPGQPILILRFNPATGRRTLDPARWGLIPHWTREAVPASKLFNARAETLAERPAFRDPFQRRRCLIPAEDFFERDDHPPRRLHRIAPRQGGLLALAGLWDNWRGPDGTWQRSATIITTEARDPVAALHPRMPVPLAPEDWPLWLGEIPAPAEALADLLRPRPRPELAARAETGPQHPLDLSPSSPPGPLGERADRTDTSADTRT